MRFGNLHIKNITQGSWVREPPRKENIYRRIGNPQPSPTRQIEKPWFSSVLELLSTGKQVSAWWLRSRSLNVWWWWCWHCGWQCRKHKVRTLWCGEDGGYYLREKVWLGGWNVEKQVMISICFCQVSFFLFSLALSWFFSLFGYSFIEWKLIFVLEII